MVTHFNTDAKLLLDAARENYINTVGKVPQMPGSGEDDYTIYCHSQTVTVTVAEGDKDYDILTETGFKGIISWEAEYVAGSSKLTNVNWSGTGFKEWSFTSAGKFTEWPHGNSEIVVSTDKFNIENTGAVDAKIKLTFYGSKEITT